MPVNLDRTQSPWVLTIEGPLGLTSALELKTALLAGLASNNGLAVDTGSAGEMDLTTMQLLLSASREAERRGIVFLSRPSAASTLAGDAGFDCIAGVSLRD